MTSGYFPNWMNKYEIGPLPVGEAKPELHELAEGITTVETESEEEEEDYAYYSHRGSTEKEITSVNSSFAFEGHRKYKDNPAQQLVRDALDKTGDGRKVYFRHTEPDGRIREGKATLSGIVHTGGDANVRGTLEFTVTFDGTPKDTKGTVPEG
ncbi:hypothetical protein CBF34_07050 [Vagococcus penaei]|nr:hypothetical protein CBF34_07050 [Vagococcus penaei]